MQLAFRLRGALGQQLKRLHCLWDPKHARCAHCAARSDCFYGVSFDPPGPVVLPGFGRVGALPHCWSLQVDLSGLCLRMSLVLVGFEAQRVVQWQQAVQQLPLMPSPCKSNAEDEAEGLLWQSLTPIRLRISGRNPRKEEVPTALARAIVRRARMLAAMHRIQAPEMQLPEPACSNLQWIDEHRARRKGEQPMGGWMMTVRWPDETPASWRPWLALLRRLGVGKQANFGLGRFACVQG